MSNAINQSRRLAGVANILIDGVSYDLVGDLVYQTSTVTRETLIGQDGVHGYKEMPVAGHISMQLRDNGGFAVQGFNQLVSSTVQTTLANGKNVVGTGCWCVETQEVKTLDGVFEIKFESDNVKEIVV